MNKKWLAPILPYLAVWAGLFLLHSAWGALIAFHLAMLFTLWVGRADIPINILFKSKSLKWVLASVIFCGISGIALYLMWDVFGVYGNLPAQVKALELTGMVWFPFIAYFTLVNPFLEEYFWRGFLGSDTKKLSAGDLLFASYHAMILWNKVPPLSIFAALVLLVTAGWFWRQLRRRDKGLLAPVLGHMAADFTILVCLYLKIG